LNLGLIIGLAIAALVIAAIAALILVRMRRVRTPTEPSPSAFNGTEAYLEAAPLVEAHEITVEYWNPIDSLTPGSDDAEPVFFSDVDELV
jgi:hypothetical protein